MKEGQGSGEPAPAECKAGSSTASSLEKTTVARSQHQSVYRWFGCQSSQAGSSIERARVQASSLATLAAEPGLAGSGNGGNGGRSSEWRRARRWECRSLGKDVTATAAKDPGEGGANCEKQHFQDQCLWSRCFSSLSAPIRECCSWWRTIEFMDKW